MPIAYRPPPGMPAPSAADVAGLASPLAVVAPAARLTNLARVSQMRQLLDALRAQIRVGRMMEPIGEEMPSIPASFGPLARTGPVTGRLEPLTDYDRALLGPRGRPTHMPRPVVSAPRSVSPWAVLRRAWRGESF